MNVFGFSRSTIWNKLFNTILPYLGDLRSKFRISLLQTKLIHSAPFFKYLQVT